MNLQKTARLARKIVSERAIVNAELKALRQEVAELKAEKVARVPSHLEAEVARLTVDAAEYWNLRRSIKNVHAEMNRRDAAVRRERADIQSIVSQACDKAREEHGKDLQAANAKLRDLIGELQAQNAKLREEGDMEPVWRLCYNKTYPPSSDPIYRLRLN